MPSSESLTQTGLLAAATEFLQDANYLLVPEAVADEYGLGTGRVFEDPYGVVAVMVYGTWDELWSSWPDHQGALVSLMSDHVASVEAKAWEGYLVLLTLGGVNEEAELGANEIRYNMSRVRKLVGIGDELRSLSDLERVLRPLLPIRPGELPDGSESALDLLPDLVSSPELPADVVRVAISAFLESRPIVEAIHDFEDDS